MTGGMQFCTISSREYLPYARVLAQGLRRHQPESSLYVLLADDLDDEVDEADEPFICVRNDELGLEPAELHRMYLIHGPQFLPAIKPFLVEHLIETTGLATVCIDSDIAIYGSLAHVGALADQHGVVLVPHARSPYPLDGLLPDDTTILGAGTFNAGVMGFGATGIPTLEFLQSRLRRECVTDLLRMRVNEQRWLDFVPSFFSCHVLCDPGVNAAYWNLHERPLSYGGDVVYAGEAPLRALHLSGYDVREPDIVSRFGGDRPRIVFADQPLLKRLYSEFGDALKASGLETHRGIPMPFGTLPGGLAVDETLRSIYRLAVIDAEASATELPPDGYDLTQRQAFCAWTRRAYGARRLVPPDWARTAGPDPSRLDPDARDAVAGTVPDAPVTAAPSTVDVGELIGRLARSSAAALTSIDERLSRLEHAVDEELAIGVSG